MSIYSLIFPLTYIVLISTLTINYDNNQSLKHKLKLLTASKSRCEYSQANISI